MQAALLVLVIYSGVYDVGEFFHLMGGVLLICFLNFCTCTAFNISCFSPL